MFISEIIAFCKKHNNKKLINYVCAKSGTVVMATNDLAGGGGQNSSTHFCQSHALYRAYYVNVVFLKSCLLINAL